MKDRVFLDTNIFVYSIDGSSGENQKRSIARKKIKEHIRNGSGVISIQVLQEFYHVATHKIQTPVSPEEAIEYMQYMAILETVHPDFQMVIAAIHLHQTYTLSFWDALILQAATLSGCSLVLSEDLQNGFCIDDLMVRNPFTAK
jgi:predicted nucleic acid-binding protein